MEPYRRTQLRAVIKDLNTRALTQIGYELAVEDLIGCFTRDRTIRAGGYTIDTFADWTRTTQGGQFWAIIYSAPRRSKLNV